MLLPRFQGKCEAVGVVPIANATTSEWFLNALGDESSYDAVLVLVHVDADDEMLETLLAAIRSKVGDATPVQFIAGHSHRRKQKTLDARAAAFEPGNYFNTVGFASFALPNQNQNQNRNENDGPIEFQFTDIDTSVASMASALNLSAQALPTANGTTIATHIFDEQQKLGLTQTLGCVAQDYPEGPELYTLYAEEIVPKAFFTPPGNASQWFVQSTGSMRYDIYQGNVTADDVYKVLPFRDALYVVRDVQGTHLTSLWQQLNHHHRQQQQLEGSVQSSPSSSSNVKNVWHARRARGGAKHGTALGFSDFLCTNPNLTATDTYDAFFVAFDRPRIEETLVGSHFDDCVQCVQFCDYVMFLWLLIK